ncbi:helix-turn-helix domain-containing protein [Neptuniibacter sp.]|uniref:MarR family transcriptional regulator n=1 Tax=Neptuniibacter sp. TaxID=1962643 RepID=UPI002635FDCD|nr:helix-turn-helix domain-containing protein [Neptuniibacter sp.]MCP4597823.1 MarR family transcriptional regulator [Neptuniibacter sp.]
MQNWQTQSAPEETAILANMDPDREYTATELAEKCGTTHQKVSSMLGAIAISGAVKRVKAADSKRYKYRVNQLSMDFKCPCCGR